MFHEAAPQEPKSRGGESRVRRVQIPMCMYMCSLASTATNSTCSKFTMCTQNRMFLACVAHIEGASHLCSTRSKVFPLCSCTPQGDTVCKRVRFVVRRATAGLTVCDLFQGQCNLGSRPLPGFAVAGERGRYEKKRSKVVCK